LSRLYAHQLGAGHALMMRIAGGAHRALDRAAAEAVAPTAALRLATIAARLGDRFRRGLLTLTVITTGPDGHPPTATGPAWPRPPPLPPPPPPPPPHPPPPPLGMESFARIQRPPAQPPPSSAQRGRACPGRDPGAGVGVAPLVRSLPLGMGSFARNRQRPTGA